MITTDIRIELLTKSIERANEFISRATKAQEECIAYKKANEENPSYSYRAGSLPSPSRLFAATKRASLDLSEVMADLRKYKKEDLTTI